MYGDKSIYCVRCKKDRWVGANCFASKKNEKCVDKVFLYAKRQKLIK